MAEPAGPVRLTAFRRLQQPGAAGTAGQCCRPAEAGPSSGHFCRDSPAWALGGEHKFSFTKLVRSIIKRDRAALVARRQTRNIEVDSFVKEFLLPLSGEAGEEIVENKDTRAGEAVEKGEEKEEEKKEEKEKEVYIHQGKTLQLLKCVKIEKDNQDNMDEQHDELITIPNRKRRWNIQSEPKLGLLETECRMMDLQSHTCTPAPPSPPAHTNITEASSSTLSDSPTTTLRTPSPSPMSRYIPPVAPRSKPTTTPAPTPGHLPACANRVTVNGQCYTCIQILYDSFKENKQRKLKGDIVKSTYSLWCTKQQGALVSTLALAHTTT